MSERQGGRETERERKRKERTDAEVAGEVPPFELVRSTAEPLALSLLSEELRESLLLALRGAEVGACFVEA